MPTFRFEGHDRFAKPLKGHVEASDEADACAQLRAKHIYAMKVELDGPEEMKTVLRHEEPSVGVKTATSAIFSKNPISPDSLELELFGNQGEGNIKIDQPVIPPSRAVSSAPAEDWERLLRARLEAISLVLRKMNEWKKNPDSGPIVGGKTWELFDSNLNQIAMKLITEAVEKAAEDAVPKSNYPPSITVTGGGAATMWIPQSDLRNNEV